MPAERHVTVPMRQHGPTGEHIRQSNVSRNILLTLRLHEQIQHCTARLTRNPWEADSYLNETFNAFIEGPESIVKTAVHSPDIKSIFQNRVQQMETAGDLVAGRIRDLSSAKQRFSSTQKPLGRFVLYFDAVVATAYELQTRREGTAHGKRGTHFLASIDEERTLTLAMLLVTKRRPLCASSTQRTTTYQRRLSFCRTSLLALTCFSSSVVASLLLVVAIHTQATL